MFFIRKKILQITILYIKLFRKIIKLSKINYIKYFNTSHPAMIKYDKKDYNNFKYLDKINIQFNSTHIIYIVLNYFILN